jgi:hypothetical protein
LLEDALLPARLKKNYLLVLSECASDGLVGVGAVTDDPMVAAAYDAAAEGEVHKMLLAPEPLVIRESYYSGQYPDYVDDAGFTY